MPFLILFSIAAIIVLLLHLRAKLSAISTLLGVIGPVITIDIITIVAIGYSTGTLQNIMSFMAIYWLIATLAITLFLALLSIKLRYQVTQCDKFIIILLAAFHHNAFAFLTANIAYYNSYFID